MVAGPLAGTAFAHHEEDGAYELTFAPPVVGPLFSVMYYPEGPEYKADAWSGYLLAHLCHVPVFQCRDIEDPYNPDNTLPLPELPLPPLPIPPPPG